MAVAPPNVTDLTNRILQNKHVEYRWGPAPTFELSAWIRNELLVSEVAPDHEKALLQKLGWRRTSSVLARTSRATIRRRPGVKDIEIWVPKSPDGFRMVE